MGTQWLFIDCGVFLQRSGFNWGMGAVAPHAKPTHLNVLNGAFRGLALKFSIAPVRALPNQCKLACIKSHAAGIHYWAIFSDGFCSCDPSAEYYPVK